MGICSGRTARHTTTIIVNISSRAVFLAGISSIIFLANTSLFHTKSFRITIIWAFLRVIITKIIKIIWTFNFSLKIWNSNIKFSTWSGTHMIYSLQYNYYNISCITPPFMALMWWKLGLWNTCVSWITFKTSTIISPICTKIWIPLRSLSSIRAKSGTMSLNISTTSVSISIRIWCSNRFMENCTTWTTWCWKFRETGITTV